MELEDRGRAVIKDTIFLYWSGPMPEHIEFCLETVKFHHPGRVRVLGEREWEYARDYLGVPSDIVFKPQHKADMVRAWALAHGSWALDSWWVDSDFLCLAPLDGLNDESKEMSLYRRVEDPACAKTFENDCMWARADGNPAREYLNAIRTILHANDFRIPRWGELGRWVLTSLFGDGDERVHEFPGEKITWGRRMCLIWDEEMAPGEEIDDLVPPDTRGMMLINSLSGEYLKQKSVEETARSSMILGSVYRMAMRRMGLSL